jgi:hypothetical protein
MSLYIFKVHSYVAFHSSSLGSRWAAFEFKNPHLLLEHFIAIFKGFYSSEAFYTTTLQPIKSFVNLFGLVRESTLMT